MTDGPVREPSWTNLNDAELLQLRVCELELRLEGSAVQTRVEQLNQELVSRGIQFRPLYYLGDEWFSPEDVPAISIPFYLAHPRLVALERKMMLEVEGEDPVECQKLLRHECGHAIEHAYQLHRRKRRKELFGPRSADYHPDTYRPLPYSRSYVRNLPNWYAQAHPDEDFAETFAVWLDPTVDWRKHYAGWKAYSKLEYIDQLIREIGPQPPAVTGGRKESEVSRLRLTLDSFYKRRRRLYAEDLPDFYDRDLQRLFSTQPPAAPPRQTAASFLRVHRRSLLNSISRWTGERKATIEQLLRRLTERCRTLNLYVSADGEPLRMDITAYLATLVTTYRFTGKFKRSV